MNEIKGFIRWYNKEKGFGFVAGEDNIDYFVHYKCLPLNVRELPKDCKVSFTKAMGKKGPLAENLKLI
jgi:CspA family cold shock protein